MISSTSTNKEMAWNFVKILLSDEVRQLIHNKAPIKSNGVPVRSSCIDKTIDIVFDRDEYIKLDNDHTLRNKYKDIYHSYDNVSFFSYSKVKFIYGYQNLMEDYVYLPQKADYETTKKKAENFLAIYLSE